MPPALSMSPIISWECNLYPRVLILFQFQTVWSQPKPPGQKSQFLILNSQGSSMLKLLGENIRDCAYTTQLSDLTVLFQLQLSQESFWKRKTNYLPVFEFSCCSAGELRWWRVWEEAGSRNLGRWRDGGAQSTSSSLITQQGDAKLGIPLSAESPVSLLHHPLAPERRLVGMAGLCGGSSSPC